MFVVFQVQEGLPAGSLLGTLQAKDPDEGENGTIFYSLSGKQAILLQYELSVYGMKGFPDVTDYLNVEIKAKYNTTSVENIKL